MNKYKIMGASMLAAGMLLSATPAFADQNGSNKGPGGNDGFRFGALISSLAHFNGSGTAFINADLKNGKGNDPATTTRMKMPFSGTAEIGVVSGVNGTDFTLSPAINLSGTSTAATTVVTNSSTTFKGGATSTASLTSGEKVIIVGTSSTSTPGVITASIVIALQNAWHFCTHLFSK